MVAYMADNDTQRAPAAPQSTEQTQPQVAWNPGDRLDVIPASGRPPARQLESVTKGMSEGDLQKLLRSAQQE